MFLTDVSGLTHGSEKIIPVKCQFNISEKCRKIVETQYSSILRTITNNNGKYICLACSNKRNSKNSKRGRDAPSTKYYFDDNFFQNIDSPEKAYLLGWIASDGHIGNKKFIIKIHKRDLSILEKLRDIICKEIPIKEYRENMVEITINSRQISKDLCKLLKLEFEEKGSHKKDFLVQFPDLETEELKWNFLRGYFDGDGSVSINKDKRSDTQVPRCNIASTSEKILDQIKDFCNIYCTVTNSQIIWTGLNAIQFLTKLYENKNDLFLKRKYNKYLSFKDWFPRKSRILETFKYIKMISDAITPLKTKSSHGYILHLIKKIKEKKDIIYYDTCIKIEPKPGYYLKLKALNIIYDLGYDLVNDGEIIDENYTGTIIAKIMKIDDEAPELELPIKLIEIVPIKK